MAKSEKLKPCPFCGGRAVYGYYVGTDNHWVSCRQCEVTITDATKEEVYIAWNRRYQ